MSLPAGGVPDPRTDQNFRGLQRRIGELAAAGELSLNLTAPAERKINFGSTKVKWAGGSQQSETKEITHGLGTTPKVVSVIESAFNVPAACFAGEKGATVFKVLAYTVNGVVPEAGFEMEIDWIAIG